MKIWKGVLQCRLVGTVNIILSGVWENGDTDKGSTYLFSSPTAFWFLTTFELFFEELSLCTIVKKNVVLIFNHF